MYNAYATRLEHIKDCTDISFFKMIDGLWKGEKCPRYPLHRFLTVMRKTKARSYITEELVLNAELQEEQEMATRRCGSDVRISKATRLTFFASPPNSVRWDNESELPNDHILGYIVVITLELPIELRTFVLEAVTAGPVVSLPSPPPNVFKIEVPNYYVHVSKEHQTCLGTQDNNRIFTIKGSFFTQQNNLTSICGHAALRMAVNSSTFLSDLLREKTGADKLTNKYINDLLGLDFSSLRTTMGSYGGDDPSKENERRRGITQAEIARVVEELGAKLFTTSFIEDASIEYDQVLYPVMESGYPVILEVQGWNIKDGKNYVHAMTVTGHVLSSDRWAPEAEYGYGNYPIRPYISVPEWVCHYIMSDDNFGMDVALPADMVRNDIVPVKNPKLHATSILSLLPKQITVTGHRAEKIAMQFAQQLITETEVEPRQYWLDILKQRNEYKSLVCRTTLLRDKKYRLNIKQLAEEKFIDPTQKHWQRLMRLPRYIWVTEISVPNIYTGNKAKLGDVLLNASATAKSLEDGDCFVLAWLPGFFVPGPREPLEPWYLRKHVPLIEAQSRLLDW